MNNPKLLEAISKLRIQRDALNAAISQLEATFKSLNPGTNMELAILSIEAQNSRISSSGTQTRPQKSGASYVDEAVGALMVAGRKLHIKAIVEVISSNRKTEVKRASVESSLIGEMKAATKQGRVSRVIRVSPGMFDIPRPIAMAS